MVILVCTTYEMSLVLLANLIQVFATTRTTTLGINKMSWSHRVISFVYYEIQDPMTSGF